MQKAVKITAQAQFVHMVAFMESHPDFARGRLQGYKDQCDKLWQKLTEELNSICLPNRDPEGWKKVWKDLKYNLKKKLLHNKKEQNSTGGGSFKQFKFAPYEEVVISILAIDKIVDVEGTSHGMPKLSSVPEVNDEQEGNIQIPQSLQNSSPIAIVEKAPIAIVEKAPNAKNEKNALQQKNTKTNERLELIKEHTKLLEKIEKKTSDMVYFMKKTLKVKEEKLALIKQDLLDQKRHRVALLEIKQRQLELRSNQLEEMQL